MNFESFDGKAIFYKTYGSEAGIPVILIHGIGADHAMFKDQVDPLVSKGFRVIIPDMRGHGQSAKVRKLELEDFAKDIQALATHVKAPKFILLGVSMGGVIALDYVSRYPEKVYLLIVSDTFAEIKALSEVMISRLQVWGFRLFKYLSPKLAASLVSSAYKDLSGSAQEYFRNVTLKADFHQLALARIAINKIDVLNKLKQLNIPALIMTGDKVNFMIPVNRKIVDHIKDAEFQIIKAAMDPSNLVCPEIFNSYLMDFLKRHEGVYKRNVASSLN